MTKVQTKFKLSRALDDSDSENVARIHAVYGIFAARPQETESQLFIEYDASRLTLKDVRAILARHGIPIT